MDFFKNFYKELEHFYKTKILRTLRSWFGPDFDSTYSVKRKPPDYAEVQYVPLCITLPSMVDLRDENMPPIYNQDKLSSCTGNAIAAAIHYIISKSEYDDIEPSRLFIYYNERLLEDNTGQDAGAYLYDGIKSVATFGVCDETLWPYDINMVNVKPSQKCYEWAFTEISTKYFMIDSNNTNDIKNVLASGYPVLCGIMVYESFKNDSATQTGNISTPNVKKEKLLGGHAICIVGYDDNKQAFIVRNSWGTTWGDNGYCYIPYDYIANINLAFDFWCILGEN